MVVAEQEASYHITATGRLAQCRRFFAPVDDVLGAEVLKAMATGLVALGSNLGDRLANIQHAIKKLDAHPSVRVVARSRPLLTEPIGGPEDQSEYINAAACVDTTLAPSQLFGLLRDVET